MAREERIEASPSEPLRPRPPFQPLPPYLDDLLAIPADLPNVSRAPIVGEVTCELRGQPLVLPAKKLMTVVPAPLLDGDQRAGKTVLRRRLPHHVLTLL